MNRTQYRVTCRNEECRRTLEHVDGFRPVLARRESVKIKPRDVMLDLAPMRRALMLPRRLSAHQPLNVMLNEDGDLATDE